MMGPFAGLSVPELGARLLALAIALTIHEFAHAWTATMAGDDTAKRAGRLSLNPIDHFDLVGGLMMLMVGFGWAKPVPINPNLFRHPRRDSMIVSFAGIGANLLMVTVIGLLLRFHLLDSIAGNDTAILVLRELLLINVSLAFFNLIPIPPLDGSHILAELLPARLSRAFQEGVGRWGFLILIGLLVTGAVGWLIGPPARFFLGLVIG